MPFLFIFQSNQIPYIGFKHGISGRKEFFQVTFYSLELKSALGLLVVDVNPREFQGNAKRKFRVFAKA
jgi:hypothetical protein